MRLTVPNRWFVLVVGCALSAIPIAPGSSAQEQNREPTTVDIIDLGAHAERLTRSYADAPDHEHPYYQSRFGSVGLHVLSYRQILPLHMHRMAHVAVAVVSGEPEIVQLHVTEDAVGPRSTLFGPGSLVYSPPYSGHRWTNPSSTAMHVLLVFASPPLMAPLDTNVYVDDDDDRLLLGGEPLVVDTKRELRSLLESGRPARQRRLPALSGKLTSLSVSATTTIDPSPGPTFVYAAGGQGRLRCAGTHRLQSQTLAFLPRNTACEVDSEPATPLALILFRPEDDGVSDILRTETKLYSQADEELVIRDFFRDRRDGVFLDVGAAHYRRNSTTFYLEERLGWSGVAVDALGEFGPDYLEHRKKTRFVNYLITDKAAGNQRFYRADGYLEVSSVSRKAAEDQALLYRGNDAITELEIPSITLTALLDRLEIAEIDFLSMDIEEHEPAALAGFDIDRFRPELVCIEAHALVQDAIFKYFTEHGYRRLDRYVSYDRFNWYFAPADTAGRRP